MRILITRPEPDGVALAEALRAAGHEPVLCPLLRIVFLPLAPLSLEGVAALIATSRNGLRGLAQSEQGRGELAFAARRLPLFCVGEATAGLARAMGFAAVWSGTGGAQDLVPLIEKQIAPADGALAHLAGERLAFDLPGALARRGYRTRLVPLYRAEPAESLPAAVVDALRERRIGGVMLMSPRTARLFADLFHHHGLVAAEGAPLCYCLSPAVAQALGASPGFGVRVARTPKAEDMLALVEPEAAH